MKTIIPILLLSILLTSCSDIQNENQTDDMSGGFQTIPKTPVMIVGTYHFAQEGHYDELSDQNQKEVAELINTLKKFAPTKVVIEKEASRDSIYNWFYSKYLDDDGAIDTLPNEAFQLGFKLAKEMGHDRIYLFDDKTEFIGSLEGFTWDSFKDAVDKEEEFVNRYRPQISSSFEANEDYLATLSLYENIRNRNSPKSQKWNAERMHIFEVRVGLQKDWLGADWLGRFYRRNIRMMGNVMSYNTPGKDRILIIVGDNHKWILDTLFSFNPEFRVESSYDLLSK